MNVCQRTMNIFRKFIVGFYLHKILIRQAYKYASNFDPRSNTNLLTSLAGKCWGDIFNGSMYFAFGGSNRYAFQRHCQANQ